MEIRFLPVGCGDGIHIRYRGNDSQYRNIFIDGGVEKGQIYPQILRKEIEKVIDTDERIDLWIITHIDDDHIGGLLRFIKDIDLRNRLDLSRTEFWFNYSSYDYGINIKKSKLKSVSQGVRLRDFLYNESKLNQAICTELGTIDLAGCKLTVLTPEKKELDILYQKWLRGEIKIREKQSMSKKFAKQNDYQIDLDDFDLTGFVEDKSEFNASSISLLLEFNGERVLLLADSQPSNVIKSLRGLYYSAQNKLKLKMMQLAHHGSSHNTNDGLLEMIDCDEFVISADGFNKNNLPHKAVIARVKKNFPNQVSKIHITHKNAATKSLLKKDERSKGIVLLFPENNENYIKIKL
ncbi:MAG: MBL fold metallo-hydrolase [Chryseobacterium cucumeris]|nr:MAG: MBL fold metallo-hydrolase [Chryseobacterium cucumeris]